MGITADEPGHLAAGYSYWRFNDYRLNPENGTLPMRIAALPMLAMNIDFPPLNDPAWLRSSAAGVADQLFFLRNNPTDQAIWCGRAMIALVGVLTVWMCWKWSSTVFGRQAGWIALLLAASCPALLAHGGLATSDVTVTACFLAAISTTWQLLHRITCWRILSAGVACGALFTAKMSGVLVVAVIVVMLAVRLTKSVPLIISFGGRECWIRRRSATAITAISVLISIAALSLVVLWGSYGFRFDGFNRRLSNADGYFFSWDVVLEKEQLPWNDSSSLASLVGPRRAPSPSALTAVIEWVRGHRLLPDAFLWGLAHTLKFSHERPAFFWGEVSKNGWWQFFPAAFLMKTTAPALLLLLGGCIALVSSTISSRGRRRLRSVYRVSPLLIFAAMYSALAVNMNLNIGHRHILPVYPIVYIVASAVVLWPFQSRKRSVAVVIAMLLVAHVAESVAARPFYLSYFQPLFGGTKNAHHYFVDSSLDWGQGLPDLAQWRKTHVKAGEALSLFLSYAGVDLPRRYGLEVTRFGDAPYDLGPRGFPAHVQGGWFAISATQYYRLYLAVRGEWTDAHEELYRRTAERLRASDRTGGSDRQASVIDAQDFELLQFARLCHWLKLREPDEVVGGSILLFRLTDAEVNSALYAPLVHLSAVGHSDSRP